MITLKLCLNDKGQKRLLMKRLHCSAAFDVLLCEPEDEKRTLHSPQNFKCRSDNSASGNIALIFIPVALKIERLIFGISKAYSIVLMEQYTYDIRI